GGGRRLHRKRPRRASGPRRAHERRRTGADRALDHCRVGDLREAAALGMVSALLARDRPVSGHDMDPGLTGLEADGFTTRVAEREDIEDVRSRPRDVLTLAVAEDRTVA